MTIGGDITEYPMPTACLLLPLANAIAAGPDGNVWYAAPHEDIIGVVTPAGNITEFAHLAGEGITARPRHLGFVSPCAASSHDSTAPGRLPST